MDREREAASKERLWRRIWAKAIETCGEGGGLVSWIQNQL